MLNIRAAVSEECSFSAPMENAKLLGPVPGARSFSSAYENSFSAIPYRIEEIGTGGDIVNWEMGQCTFFHAENELSRDYIELSSNGNQPVVFGTGRKRVFVYQPADPHLSNTQEQQVVGQVALRVDALWILPPVRLAVDTHVDLSTPLVSLQGIELIYGDRVLLLAQNDGQSMVYKFNEFNLLVFANDSLQYGKTTYVQEGSLAKRFYTFTSSSPAGYVWEQLIGFPS